MKTVIFTVAATITSLLFLNFCDAVFACGCVALWNGADAHCNIHLAGPRHCPWCTYGRVASAIPWALIVAVQGAISFWPGRFHGALRLALAVAAFPLAGMMLALPFLY